MANKISVSNYFWSTSSIVLTFSIVAYPVWVCCMLHDATVDILFGTERKV